MSDDPRAVTIRILPGGWLVECDCGGLTRICGSRPSADRVAADHRAAHGRAREREG